jgi:hypothetical protein
LLLLLALCNADSALCFANPSCTEAAAVPQALTALSAAQLSVSQAAGSWQCDSQVFLRQQQLLQPFHTSAAHYAKGKGGTTACAAHSFSAE